MQQQPRRYSSMEELEADFQRQIDSVDDPVEKAELRVNKAEAQVAYRRQEAEGRMADAWKRLAMVEYPNAGKFPELITGNTEEEIRQSAKDVHERVTSLADRTAGASVFDQVRSDVGNPYGRPGVIGGGAAPGSAYVAPDMAEERWRNRFAQQFNEAQRNTYGERMGISPRDVDRYTTGRAVEHLKDRIHFFGRLTNSSYRG
jgi:hypothetical protein